MSNLSHMHPDIKVYKPFIAGFEKKLRVAVDIISNQERCNITPGEALFLEYLSKDSELSTRVRGGIAQHCDPTLETTCGLGHPYITPSQALAGESSVRPYCYESNYSNTTDDIATEGERWARRQANPILYCLAYAIIDRLSVYQIGAEFEVALFDMSHPDIDQVRCWHAPCISTPSKHARQVQRVIEAMGLKAYRSKAETGDKKASMLLGPAF